MREKSVAIYFFKQTRSWPQYQVKQLVFLHAQSHDIPANMWQGFYKKVSLMSMRH